MSRVGVVAVDGGRVGGGRVGAGGGGGAGDGGGVGSGVGGDLRVGEGGRVLDVLLGTAASFAFEGSRVAPSSGSAVSSSSVTPLPHSLDACAPMDAAGTEGGAFVPVPVTYFSCLFAPSVQLRQ